MSNSIGAKLTVGLGDSLSTGLIDGASTLAGFLPVYDSSVLKYLF